MQYKVDSKVLEITGRLNRIAGFWTGLFRLRQHNRNLQQENARLYERLNKREFYSPAGYQVIPAEIISGKFYGRRRYVILNKGSRAGVGINDGIWTSRGAVGAVTEVSPHFAKALILTDDKFSISVRVKSTGDLGFTAPLEGSSSYINVTDLPFESHVRRGDTVITSGLSMILPPGIPVGVVTDIRTKSEEEKILTVRLTAPPRKTRYVYVGAYPLRKEFNDINEAENEN